MFPVRDELDSYILFRCNSAFEGLIQLTGFAIPKDCLFVQYAVSTSCQHGYGNLTMNGRM
jgi:hypothetical protein